ncbi:hypothetical protein CRE_19537 [Caenorhabditis remanei]|uniref:Uncharacterized protein n=1 Tax=Caenorhabditis remanei TaxID=31234 RepID=E3NJ80_CAERE|nr:hypothetical protein CRE_19537 [Caenorhabditis remanei]
MIHPQPKIEVNGYSLEDTELERRKQPERIVSTNPSVLGLTNEIQRSYYDDLINTKTSLDMSNRISLETMMKPSFTHLNELIKWARGRTEQLTKMKFPSDLKKLEFVAEQHKITIKDICDFGEKVEESDQYSDLILDLGADHRKLRDAWDKRKADLETLTAFVHAVQKEIDWIETKEKIEASRDWSQFNKLDLTQLANDHQQILKEIKLRKTQFVDVQKKGEDLIEKKHPAGDVIESYLDQLRTKWKWLSTLCKCFENHLKGALDLKTCLEEVADAEKWIGEQSAKLQNNFNETGFSVEEGLGYMRE